MTVITEYQVQTIDGIQPESYNHKDISLCENPEMNKCQDKGLTMIQGDIRTSVIGTLFMDREEGHIDSATRYFIFKSENETYRISLNEITGGSIEDHIESFGGKIENVLLKKELDSNRLAIEYKINPLNSRFRSN